MSAARCIGAEHIDRDAETEQHGGRDDERCCRSLPSRELHARRSRLHVCRARRVKPLAPARPLLCHQKGENEHQHQHCDLRRTFQAAAIEPRREDRQRQRAHAQIFRRTEIVERLHEDECDARDDCGTRHGQQDATEYRERLRAKGARHIGDIATLHDEDDARRQIDVGIEHAGHHQCGSARRAQVRKPVIAGGLEPEERAPQRLHGAGKKKEFRESVRRQIGWYRQRQHKRPGQRFAKGKIIADDEPGACNAGHGRQYRHQRQQVQCRQRGPRQYGRDQMRPCLASARKRDTGERGDG